MIVTKNGSALALVEPPVVAAPPEPAPAAKPAFAPNDEQAKAIELMQEFLLPKGDAEPAGKDFFLLSGPAGTGKTSCVTEVVKGLSRKTRFAFTAPTNKATKVLRESGCGALGPCATIYSLLGLKLETNGDVKQLAYNASPTKLNDVDAVFVDEGSMVSDRLYAEIVKAQRESGIPFIFMGDPAQLPPVKELTSPIWSIPQKAELVKVMRHDNQILKLATHIRSCIYTPFQTIKLDSNYGVAIDGEPEGVWRMIDGEFYDRLRIYAKAGHFSTGHSKAIAWRNAVVDKLNMVIRDTIMGPTPLPYEVGDRIIALSPCQWQESTLMHTDSEGVVIKVTEDTHPWYKDLRTMLVKVRKDEGGVVDLIVIHPDSIKAYNAQIKSFADSKSWKKFWSLKEAFHEIRNAYAITAHRSQGSTYHSTFVNFKDILVNPNRPEALRCLYVACTRSKKALYLTGG